MNDRRLARPLAGWLVMTLQFVRVVAVLAVLFGVGAAGSSFESRRNARGQDTSVFGGGILAILGLKDPADGDMTPVWAGRLCVVLGIAITVATTIVLDRHRRTVVALRSAGSADDQVSAGTPAPPPLPGPASPPPPPPS